MHTKIALFSGKIKVMVQSKKLWKFGVDSTSFCKKKIVLVFAFLSNIIECVISSVWYKKIASIWTSLVVEFFLILERHVPKALVFYAKKFFRRRGLVGFTVSLSAFFIVITFVQSATYSFTQSSWAGGADTSATSTHASNQSNWTKYYSSTGLDVGTTVSITPTSYAFTDDGATSTTPSASTVGGGFSNGTLSLTAVSGSGSGASVGIVPTLNAVNSWDTVLKGLPEAFTGIQTRMVRDGSSDDIYVMMPTSLYKYTISTNTWTTLGAIPGTVGHGFDMIRNGSDDYIYVTRGGGTTGFYRYSISGNSWTTLTVVPGALQLGSNMIRNAGDNDIYVTQGNSGVGFYRYSVSGNSWTTLTNTPAGIGNGSKMIRNASDNDIYVTRGGSNTNFYKYSISGNSWTSLVAVPGAIGIGGNMLRNASDDDIYVLAGNSSAGFYKYSISGNSWTTLSSTATWSGGTSAFLRNGSEDYIYLMRYTGGHSYMARYSISGNSWNNMADILESIGEGVFMLRNGADNEIYAVAGWSGNRGFYRYSISGNSWTGSSVSNLNSVPGGVAQGSSMIRNSSDDDIYIMRGNNTSSFYKYSISGNSWTTLTSIPGVPGYGSNMIRNGSDDFIYVTNGGVSNSFYRYSISGNSWTTLSTTPNVIGNGSSMIRNGSDDYIYISQGSGGTGFYRYSISGNSWTTLTVTPGAISYGSTMIRNGSDDDIYITQGNSTGFYKYSISGNSWTTLTSVPASISDGGKLIRNGTDNDIYLIRGGNNTSFYRYSISGNSWTTLTSAPGAVGLGGGIVRNGNNNDIYALAGAGSTGLYKYSISGNSWTSLTSLLGGASLGSLIMYDNSGDNLYILRGWGYNAFYKFIINTTTYDPSGVFTSAPINLAGGGNFSTVSFSTTLNSQTITLKARSSESSDFSSAPAWGGCSTITNNASLSTGGCVTDGHQYVQYQATLSTSNNLVTPTLDSVTINYSQYASGTLMSSPYDTGSSENLVSKITWTGTATSSTQTIRFQVRSSSDGSTWSAWCGPSITCDGSDYFTEIDNGVTLNSSHPLRIGSDDRYFQYKVYLGSGGAVSPVLTGVILQYVVNATPDFDTTYGTNGVVVTQVTDEGDNNYGKVLISYRVRDTDGSTGTLTPGYVTPSFEYNTGGGWITIATSTLQGGDTSNKSVDDTTYSTYTAVWSASSTLVNTFSSSTRIRVTVNDNEGANNIGTAISDYFSLDTKVPTTVIHFDSSSGGASSGSVVVSVNDNSQVQYRLCNDVDFPSTDSQGNSCSWSALSGNVSSSSVSWVPHKDSTGNEVVFLEAKDNVGNITQVTSVAPSMPANFDFKDISNTSIDSYREFLSWAVFQATSSSSFASYKLYHSTDGISYSLLSTITDQSINYYRHDIASATSSTHFYKLLVEDADGDLSDYTVVLSDVPNGQGSSDTTAPTIEPASILVPGGNLKNSSVQVTFTTDELAKGEVEYRQNGSSTWTTVSNLSYVLSHSIYIQNLTPNTEYNLRVRAEDVSGNVSSYVNGPNFTTVGGPVITGVNAINLTDNSVTIFWNSSTSSDSYVYYSTNQNIIPSITAWSATNVPCATSICQHKIDIDELVPGTRYYYYVKSTDGDGNTTIDDNNGSYYTFSTTLDVNAPEISNIATPVISSNAAVIVWQTDEPATSQVEWGTASGTLSRTTVLDSTKSAYHVVTLSNDTIDTNMQTQALTADSRYFFRVLSRDVAGNSTTSPEQSFSTAKDGEVVIVTQFVGGGVSSNNYTSTLVPDTTAPEVTSNTVEDIGAFSAKVTIQTNEKTLAFVSYGDSTVYSSVEGSEDFSTSKTITLKKLQPGTSYHYRIKVVDASGNFKTLTDATFKTLLVSELLSDRTFLDKATDIQGKLEELIESALPSLSPPSVSTPSVVNITENSATISWNTNIKALGSLAYATDDDYKTSKESYTLTAQTSEQKESTHTIELSDLKPNTKYHIQASSYVFPQVVGKSKDFTFITKAPSIQGSILERKTDSFRAVWTSGYPATSIVEYKNIRTGELNRKVEKEFTKNHDVVVSHLNPGDTYEVTLSGVTTNGNSIESREPFIVIMGVDTTPPQIALVKVNSALTSNGKDRAQAVISWTTDEPATTVVRYEEGSGTTDKELANSIEETSENYTTSHATIIPSLKAGSIYRIQVSSKDEAGNERKLPVRTIITPQKNESVIDVIFSNFEDTFKVFKQVR